MPNLPIGRWSRRTGGLPQAVVGYPNDNSGEVNGEISAAGRGGHAGGRGRRHGAQRPGGGVPRDLAAAPPAERGAVELAWIRSRRLRGAPAGQRLRLREILDRVDELPDELANQARLEVAEIDMAPGQQEHARALARHVVEFHEANGTPYDPLATRARYALANADMTLGLLERKPDWDPWPKAEADLRALLTEQERDLGMRNIVTLTTRTAIGWALISQGEARRARDHAKAVLAVLARRTGTGHPLYLRCAYVLGMAYCHLSKFPQAVAYLDAAHRGQVITLARLIRRPCARSSNWRWRSNSKAGRGRYAATHS